MTLYETIFTRRSVRSYENGAMPDSELRALRDFIDGTNRLEGAAGRFEVVGRDAVRAMAPHYALAYCDGSDAELANVGFVLENADLYLQSRGFGSLFLGMQKPVGGAGQGFEIMLAFGKTSVPARAGEGDFDRLPVGEVSGQDNAVARAARLAPSAMNSQPWRFEFGEGRVSIMYKGRGLKKLILRRLNKIDLGIAARCAELALLDEGRSVTAVRAVNEGKELGVRIEFS